MLDNAAQKMIRDQLHIYISEWFANHQELPRITKNHPKEISEWITKH